jgi:hypothetical protein
MCVSDACSFSAPYLARPQPTSISRIMRQGCRGVIAGELFLECLRDENGRAQIPFLRRVAQEDFNHARFCRTPMKFLSHTDEVFAVLL